MPPHVDEQGAPTTRPVPNAHHVAQAEKIEQERQAINYVMARDSVDYPTAKATVASEGAEKLLAEREGDDLRAHEKSMAKHALEMRLKIPGETSKFLLELNDRMAALEGRPADAIESDRAAAEKALADQLAADRTERMTKATPKLVTPSTAE
jgi:hypothetical protein